MHLKVNKRLKKMKKRMVTITKNKDHDQYKRLQASRLHENFKDYEDHNKIKTDYVRLQGTKMITWDYKRLQTWRLRGNSTDYTKITRLIMKLQLITRDYEIWENFCSPDHNGNQQLLTTRLFLFTHTIKKKRWLFPRTTLVRSLFVEMNKR